MNTKQIKRFFELAKNASTFSDYTKKNIHIGSVLVYKNKVIGITLDISFFLSFAVICVLISYLFGFPDFRVYTWIGYALGGILYLKILHRIVAFFENVCYNKVTQWVKKAKNREKTLKRKTGKRL